ncbi:MAG: radical SAM family heme chaperone HemW [Alphaproteobacteria bacterium]
MQSLYIHFPFCLKKCAYCAFNSYPMGEIDFKAWLEKYLVALNSFADNMDKKPLSSIYFGGGTPSLMPEFMLAELVENAEKILGFSDNIEISIEANPNTINQNMVNGIKNAGINRLSIGIQSFNDKELTFLGRIHNVKEALQAFEIAHKTFQNISIDLIYGLPEQTLDDWHKNLEQALTLKCPHYSLYQLSIEKGSLLETRKLPAVDDDTALNMLKLNQSLLKTEDIQQYEVSNYALSGYECRHNILGWQGYDYIGIGAGACSRITSDHKFLSIIQEANPQKWFDNPQDMICETLTPITRAEELVILGLRLHEGINSNVFYQNCGKNLLDVIDEKVLSDFCESNLLIFEDNILKTTESGLLVLDYLLLKLLKTL